MKIISALITKKGYLFIEKKNYNVLNTEVLVPCYTDELSIISAKFNDLLIVCQGRIIPQEYYGFYIYFKQRLLFISLFKFCLSCL